MINSCSRPRPRGTLDYWATHALMWEENSLRLTHLFGLVVSQSKITAQNCADGPAIDHWRNKETALITFPTKFLSATLPKVDSAPNTRPLGSAFSVWRCKVYPDPTFKTKWENVVLILIFSKTFQHFWNSDLPSVNPKTRFNVADFRDHADNTHHMNLQCSQLEGFFSSFVDSSWKAFHQMKVKSISQQTFNLSNFIPSKKVLPVKSIVLSPTYRDWCFAIPRVALGSTMLMRWES